MQPRVPPPAFGNDRVRPGEGNAIRLECRFPKAWKGRIDAHALRTEHPGTAVQWEGALWEVVDVASASNGVTTYTLLPWNPEHAVRVCETYDAETEALRAIDREKARRREKIRRGGTMLSFLVGHLPGAVQMKLHDEWGFPLVMPTVLSAIPFFIFGAVSLIFFMASTIGSAPPFLPIPVLLVGIYFFVESLLRCGAAIGGGRPVGSFPGTLFFAIFLLTRGKTSWEGSDRVEITTSPDEERAALDRFHLLEPLITLLPAADQERIEKRFGADLAKTAKLIAVILLVLVGVTIVIQIRSFLAGGFNIGRMITFGVNAFIFIEQLLRLARIRRGEHAGSILGLFVRPFTRKLVT